MAFMKNHIGTSILRLVVAAVFMIGVAAPGFAARIDDGTPAKPASTLKLSSPTDDEKEKVPAADQNSKGTVVQPLGQAAAPGNRCSKERAGRKPARGNPAG